MANVNTHYKTRYGLDFPARVSDVQIELDCAKKWREPRHQAGQLLDPWDHMLNACRKLFTKEEFSISPWTEEHAHDWTATNFCITWGCASSSKSNDYGCFALLDYITDPAETVTILASTTKKMLGLRSYESVMRYFKLLKRNPHFRLDLKESKQAMAILNTEDAHVGASVVTEKASIRGVAVQQGTEEDARAELQGAHLPYVRLLLDEMAAMRPAAARARFNLMAGTIDFRFFGLANPETFFDLSAQHAEPKDGGWPAVTAASTFWKSHYGWVRHHDGMQSPAIKEPDKYPYLINGDYIEEVKVQVRGNMDDPIVSTMVRGFPSEAGETATVLSPKDLDLFSVKEIADIDIRRVKPRTIPLMVAGLDPAFTTDGDNCALQVLEVVPVRVGDGVLAWVARCFPMIYIPIESSSDRPVTYQIVDKTKAVLAEHNIPIEWLCVDDSATQSVADVIDVEVGSNGARHCIRSSFGSSATQLAISALNVQPAKERCRNQATELWMLGAEFIKGNQVRELSAEVALQFATRRVKKTGAGLHMLESKKDYKLRLRGSPDEGDAFGLSCIALRSIGFYPSGPWAVGNVERPDERVAIRGAPPGVETVDHVTGGLRPAGTVRAHTTHMDMRKLIERNGRSTDQHTVENYVDEGLPAGYSDTEHSIY